MLKRQVSFGLMFMTLVILVAATPGIANDRQLLQLTSNTPFGRPGEVFDWTVSLTNSTDAPLQNVQLQLIFPPGITLLSALPTIGDVDINRQDSIIHVRHDALAAGYTLTVPVRVRLSKDYNANTITALARLNANDGAIVAEQEAHAIIVESLPATGESPAWRTPLLVLLFIGGILIFATSISGQVRQ